MRHAFFTLALLAGCADDPPATPAPAAPAAPPSTICCRTTASGNPLFSSDSVSLGSIMFFCAITT